MEPIKVLRVNIPMPGPPGLDGKPKMMTETYVSGDKQTVYVVPGQRMFIEISDNGVKTVFEKLLQHTPFGWEYVLEEKRSISLETLRHN